MPFTPNNGSSNGSTPMLSPKSAKQKSLSSSTASMINSKVMMICLGSLIFVTILVDTYFLSWPSLLEVGRRNNNSHRDAFQGFLNRRPPVSSTSGNVKGYAQVDLSQRSQRHFKFQDEENNNQQDRPTMPKSNHDVTEASNDKHEASSTSSSDVVGSGKGRILQVFAQAGIPPLNASMIALLPTWDQIVKVIGPHPVVGGLDTCEAFRQTVPAVERMLGSAGMFNTGTNLVTHLLKGNCKIPERVAHYGADASKEMHGMRWQVPWGKHSPAKFKEEHSTKKAKEINKDWIMPVVTIRHPYSWMHSMCKNGYTARWHHGRKGHNCPNLKPQGNWNEVTTKYADGRVEYSDSLAHLWNDWYKMYLEDAKYPRLVVRLEDLVFHAKETTAAICTCVGGEMQTDKPFTYVLDSAKADSRGHDTSTGFIQAWIKYSKDIPPNGGMTKADYEAAIEALNPKFMEQFQYKHAEPGDDER